MTIALKKRRTDFKGLFSISVEGTLSGTDAGASLDALKQQIMAAQSAIQTVYDQMDRESEIKISDQRYEFDPLGKELKVDGLTVRIGAIVEAKPKLEAPVKIIIDPDNASLDSLKVLFAAAHDQIETLPVPSNALPVFGMFRCYGRLWGEKVADGRWTLREEFFYGEGSQVPQNPKIEKTGREWTDCSVAEVSDLVQGISGKTPSGR